jgi:uncharacterized protein YijF (DUF1287 family)
MRLLSLKMRVALAVTPTESAKGTRCPQATGAWPDAHIDHRRVPDLRTCFRRVGAEGPVSNRALSYRPPGGSRPLP